MQVQSFVIQIMYMVAFSVESVSGRSTHRYNSLPSYSTRCGGVAHVVPLYLVSVMENYLDQIWWLDIYTRLFIAFNQSQSDSCPEQHSATYLPITALSHRGGGYHVFSKEKILSMLTSASQE